MTQQPAPPLHADLLLADDRRSPWQPAAGLDSLWQRLRLLVITQLWDAYCRARLRPEQPTLAAHIAARVVSAGRSQMRRRHSAPSWGTQPLAQPTTTAEVFQSRWCHKEVLCSRPAEVTTCTGRLRIQCRYHDEHMSFFEFLILEKPTPAVHDGLIACLLT